MKIRIETNILASAVRYFQALVACVKEFKVVVGVLLVIALLCVGAGLFEYYKPVIRNIYVAQYAHMKSGGVQPFDEGESGYTRNQVIDENFTFGIRSNSMWIADYLRLIVPYMQYEKVSARAYYPKTAGAAPLLEKRSFHVGGSMNPGEVKITLNERNFLDERWNDKRRALSTLVHELVHAQGGGYLTGTSQQLENKTVQATTEVLAAMCNYGDQLACAAFWDDIEHFARSGLLIQTKNMGVPGVYEWLAEALWRTDSEQMAYEKAMRYYADKEDELWDLRVKYNLIPWDNIVYGVIYDIPLDTGHVVCCSCTGICKVLGMPFDDIKYLFKGLMWILE